MTLAGKKLDLEGRVPSWRQRAEARGFRHVDMMNQNGVVLEDTGAGYRLWVMDVGKDYVTKDKTREKGEPCMSVSLACEEGRGGRLSFFVDDPGIRGSSDALVYNPGKGGTKGTYDVLVGPVEFDGEPSFGSMLGSIKVKDYRAPVSGNTSAAMASLFSQYDASNQVGKFGGMTYKEMKRRSNSMDRGQPCRFEGLGPEQVTGPFELDGQSVRLVRVGMDDGKAVELLVDAGAVRESDGKVSVMAGYSLDRVPYLMDGNRLDMNGGELVRKQAPDQSSAGAPVSGGDGVGKLLAAGGGFSVLYGVDPDRIADPADGSGMLEISLDDVKFRVDGSCVSDDADGTKRVLVGRGYDKLNVRGFGQRQTEVLSLDIRAMDDAERAAGRDGAKPKSMKGRSFEILDAGTESEDYVLRGVKSEFVVPVECRPGGEAGSLVSVAYPGSPTGRVGFLCAGVSEGAEPGTYDVHLGPGNKSLCRVQEAQVTVEKLAKRYDGLNQETPPAARVGLWNHGYLEDVRSRDIWADRGTGMLCIAIRDGDGSVAVDPCNLRIADGKMDIDLGNVAVDAVTWFWDDTEKLEDEEVRTYDVCKLLDIPVSVSPAVREAMERASQFAGALAGPNDRNVSVNFDVAGTARTVSGDGSPKRGVQSTKQEHFRTELDGTRVLSGVSDRQVVPCGTESYEIRIPDFRSSDGYGRFLVGKDAVSPAPDGKSYEVRLGRGDEGPASYWLDGDRGSVRSRMTYGDICYLHDENYGRRAPKLLSLTHIPEDRMVLADVDESGQGTHWELKLGSGEAGMGVVSFPTGRVSRFGVDMATGQSTYKVDLGKEDNEFWFATLDGDGESSKDFGIGKITARDLMELADKDRLQVSDDRVLRQLEEKCQREQEESVKEQEEPVAAGSASMDRPEAEGPEAQVPEEPDVASGAARTESVSVDDGRSAVRPMRVYGPMSGRCVLSDFPPETTVHGKNGSLGLRLADDSGTEYLIELDKYADDGKLEIKDASAQYACWKRGKDSGGKWSEDSLDGGSIRRMAGETGIKMQVSAFVSDSVVVTYDPTRQFEYCVVAFDKSQFRQVLDKLFLRVPDDEAPRKYGLLELSSMRRLDDLAPGRVEVNLGLPFMTYSYMLPGEDDLRKAYTRLSVNKVLDHFKDDLSLGRLVPSVTGPSDDREYDG